MNPDELARRHPVWDALSDAFLDTETRVFLPRIARTLADSGYDEAELRRIWSREAIPEWGENLISGGGEWGALPVVDERLAARADGRLLEGGWVARWSLAAQTEPTLNALLELRKALLVLPPELRVRYERVWSAFAHGFVDEALDTARYLERHLEDVRHANLGREALLKTFGLDFRPVYRELLHIPERATEERRSMLVLELIHRAG